MSSAFYVIVAGEWLSMAIIIFGRLLICIGCENKHCIIVVHCFLQALPEVVRSDTDDQTAIGKMQAFKEREPEEVRWRSVSKHVGNVNLLTKLEDMRMLVYQNATLVDLDVLLPGSASEVNVVNFIGEAHRRSLKATDLKQEGKHNMRVEYQQLLKELPASTVKKVPRGQLDTLEGQALAITQLVSKHSGEVVELDPRKQEWRLLDLSAVPGSARFLQSFTKTEQIWCMPDGRTRSLKGAYCRETHQALPVLSFPASVNCVAQRRNDP